MNQTVNNSRRHARNEKQLLRRSAMSRLGLKHLKGKHAGRAKHQVMTSITNHPNRRPLEREHEKDATQPPMTNTMDHTKLRLLDDQPKHSTQSETMLLRKPRRPIKYETMPLKRPKKSTKYETMQLIIKPQIPTLYPRAHQVDNARDAHRHPKSGFEDLSRMWEM